MVLDFFRRVAPGPPHVPSEENRAIQAFGVWEGRGYGRLTVIYRGLPYCVQGRGTEGPSWSSAAGSASEGSGDGDLRRGRETVTRPRPGLCALFWFSLYWGTPGSDNWTSLRLAPDWANGKRTRGSFSTFRYELIPHYDIDASPQPWKGWPGSCRLPRRSSQG